MQGQWPVQLFFLSSYLSFCPSSVSVVSQNWVHFQWQEFCFVELHGLVRRRCQDIPGAGSLCFRQPCAVCSAPLLFFLYFLLIFPLFQEREQEKGGSVFLWLALCSKTGYVLSNPTRTVLFSMCWPCFPCWIRHTALPPKYHLLHIKATPRSLTLPHPHWYPSCMSSLHFSVIVWW